jgi:hypothetical protein
LIDAHPITSSPVLSDLPVKPTNPGLSSQSFPIEE